MSTGFKEIEEKTLKKLKKTELEILDEIDRICKKNDINFFLVGGTLLGAVRHKGFIPWDDDLDIGMMRDDFIKFTNAVNNDLNDKYFFDYFSTDKNYHLPFAKVRKNNTTFDEETSKNFDNHKGMFVDIFPYDYTDDNFKRCFIKATIIQILSDTVLVKKKIMKLSSCRHSVVSLLCCVFPANTILKFIDFLSRKFNGKKENYTHVVCFNSLINLKKDYFNINDIFPLKKIQFEKKMYNGLNDNDKFLTVQYGDYMQLPPIDERVNHTAINISFNEGKNMINKCK